MGFHPLKLLTRMASKVVLKFPTWDDVAEFHWSTNGCSPIEHLFANEA